MRSVMPFYESIGTVVRRVYDLRIEGPPRGRLPPASDRPRWLRFGGSRAGFHRSDPLLRDDPFVAIHGASHTVLRLAINQWQQPQNDCTAHAISAHAARRKGPLLSAPP